MAYVYIVTGPLDNTIEILSRYRLEGKEPLLITEGVQLRGRQCGEVVLLGDYMNRWNIQDILESIERFEQKCKDEPQIDNDKPEEFYDYGIE